MDDDYSVQVELKDESTFAYTPRRFTYNEKLQIKKITNDLLSRNIIKVSTSPYCARVVPIRKKIGTLRLRVNLRPLNKRIMKRKYLFPVIKVCLARLGNKSIFTFLVLNDDFHQIGIHPEHHKLEFLDGLSFRKGPDKPRFAVPDSMINNIIRICHDNMTHCSLEKTIDTAFTS